MAVWGLLAEYENARDLLNAAEQVRDAGFRRWDCHSPFPVHGLDKAMGLGDTKLPWVVLAAAFAGAGSAMLMQWWMNAIDYQLVIGGKPLFSLPANIPVAFELTILFSATAAFFAMFAFNKLPQFYHPVFRSLAFKRVTNDRFFITIEAADPRFDAQRTVELLEATASCNIERLED